MAFFFQGAALLFVTLMLYRTTAGCGYPWVPDNVKFTIVNTGGQMLAVFSCKEQGFKPDPPVSACDSTFWGHSDVVCAASECPNPPTLDHGSYNVSGLNKSRGALINYTCDPGYEMRGPGYLTCEIRRGNGTWAPEPPLMSCVKAGDDPVVRECPNPPTLDHGSYNVSGLNKSRGALINYTCDPGYEMQGPGYLTCEIRRGNVTWAPEPPLMSCVKAGDDPFSSASSLHPHIYFVSVLMVSTLISPMFFIK